MTTWDPLAVWLEGPNGLTGARGCWPGCETGCAASLEVVRTVLSPAGGTETALALTRRARRMNRTLAVMHPDAHCELNFATPLELVVATILSAQCTDKRVNLTTPALFARYPDAAAYAGADRG